MGARGAKAARRKTRERRRELVARWRHEQIEAALPAILTRAARAAIVREIGAKPVTWPSGDVKRIPRATCYRWIRLYNRGGLMEQPGFSSQEGLVIVQMLGAERIRIEAFNDPVNLDAEFTTAARIYVR